MQRQPEDYQYKPLTGHVALAVNGVPSEFATQCMIILAKYKVSSAWRVADHDNPAAVTTEKKRLALEISSHPKPSDVTEKSGDWGFTQWFIADDPLLGRYNDKGMPVNMGIKRSKRVEPVQHFVSLRFILSGLSKNPPTMQLDDITEDNCLHITCLDAPNGAPKKYRIQLQKGERPEAINAAALRVLPDSARIKPEWWPEKLHFAQMLDQRFPVEMAKHTPGEFAPVRVLGIRDPATQKINPIITDMDLLWISNPDQDSEFVQACKERNIPLLQTKNCYDPVERRELLAAMKQIAMLDRELYSHHPEMLDNLDIDKITTEDLSRMGSVTPFIAYLIVLTNQRFRLFAEHLEDLMQHGPEIFNPNKPSVLGATLNITGGEIIQTFCEEDQAKYALKLVEQGYTIPLHPKWDMSIWSPVIDAMIKNGCQINDDVSAAHEKYQQSLDQQAPSPFMRKLFRSASSTVIPLLSRRSSLVSSLSPRSPPIPQHSRSAGDYIVQIQCPDIKGFDDNSSLLGRDKQRTLRTFCDDSRKHDNNTDEDTTHHWTHENKFSVSLTVTHGDNPSETYRFKIESMKISLVSGAMNDDSIKAIKDLCQLLFGRSEVKVMAQSSHVRQAVQEAIQQQRGHTPKF